MLCAAPLCAQRTDYDLVVQPSEAKARDFAEYLVQLAWMNSPQAAMAYEEVENAQEHSKNLRREWMRDVGATFNLNEGNIVVKSSDANIFFPRYNFGFNINLYNIFTLPTKNRIGKHNVKITEYKVNDKKLSVRAETLGLYAKYKLTKEVYKLRVLLEQELYNGFVLMEQLYKTDEKNLDDYTNASSAYFQAKENRIKAETDVLLAKILLEEMIGIRWEQIQHPTKEE